MCPIHQCQNEYATDCRDRQALFPSGAGPATLAYLTHHRPHYDFQSSRTVEVKAFEGGVGDPQRRQGDRVVPIAHSEVGKAM